LHLSYLAGVIAVGGGQRSRLSSVDPDMEQANAVVKCRTSLGSIAPDYDFGGKCAAGYGDNAWHILAQAHGLARASTVESVSKGWMLTVSVVAYRVLRTSPPSAASPSRSAEGDRKQC
jgi:hypothetical protein